MEPKFQTSFIPKKPILSSGGAVKRSIDFFLIIGVVVFLSSVVLLAGVYTYKIILNTRVQNLQDSLAKARGQFDETFIDAANRLNTRIETSKDLLSRHVSASTIFGFLASHTLATVSYTDFSYTYDVDGTVKVELHGLAQSYNTIALQSEEFGKQNQYIKSPIFSGLNPDQSGNVTFTLTAFLDKNLISYQKTLTGASDSSSTDSSAASTTNSSGF